MIELVAADPRRHADLVRGWMCEPHVTPWWGHPVEDYLEAQLALPHLQPWIALDDRVPFAYLETYRAAEDPLAAHYQSRPDDLGFHLLVTRDYVGTGAARELVGQLLEHPGRVVCEPDERNARMLAFCRALGGEVREILELRDKRAALVVWE